MGMHFQGIHTWALKKQATDRNLQARSKQPIPTHTASTRADQLPATGIRYGTSRYSTEATVVFGGLGLLNSFTWCTARTAKPCSGVSREPEL